MSQWGTYHPHDLQMQQSASVDLQMQRSTSLDSGYGSNASTSPYATHMPCPSLQAEPNSYNSTTSRNSQYYGSYPCQELTPKKQSLFLCLYESCGKNGLGFARKADLQRHVDIVHGRDSLQLVDCKHPDCHRKGEYGFTRKDKMTDHMRDVHKASIPKRPVPKATQYGR